MPENSPSSSQAPRKTTVERRAERISQLQARLQKEKALVAEAARKERNGQLIAFGIYLENFIRTHPDQVTALRSQFQRLDLRNRDRALAGLERVLAEKAEAQAKAARKNAAKPPAGSHPAGAVPSGNPAAGKQ